jgi:hypothetical protein
MNTYGGVGNKIWMNDKFLHFSGYSPGSGSVICQRVDVHSVLAGAGWTYIYIYIYIIR